MKIEFTLDCIDLPRMTEFWQGAAGFVVTGAIEGRYVFLHGHGVALTLQRVDEPKTVKNRMHLDLLVDDVDSEVHRLEELGATRVTPTPREEFGQTWFVLADPGGHEFCVAKDPEGLEGDNGGSLRRPVPTLRDRTDRELSPDVADG